MNAPPSEDDWRSEPWCLDAKAAYERFNGKTLDEAFDMVSDDALNREEDLLFMPSICFRYYLHAYLSYLRSDAARGDSDGASCVFGLIDHRIDDLSMDPVLLRKAAETIAYVGERQEWYDADVEIYGSFERKANRLLRKLNIDW